ncbi:hypothetical protein [Humibacter ginsenosidimutans]|uniref:Uncharacterized protein n=1 Tax=Humibacter ginsenosidimutans TaxID=2599293 RepID=A0A5B8M3U1_9MICO|nr:hypothetical protein [Humibacter ginsenosidimutans]QDZ14250.1 hypothetical protein FPZ11_05245 [Humibacter ginsenosidimutans]
MAAGDDAAAAGYPVVDPSTDLVKDGADAINDVTDTLAKLTNDQGITIFVQSTTPTALHTNDLWLY